MKLSFFRKPASQPLPSAGVALHAANALAERAEGKAMLDNLPSGGNAIIITMVPDEDGIQVRSLHYPFNMSSVESHGFYNYVYDYIGRRLND